MTRRKTVAELESELLSKPVEYHINGVPRLPVTWTQLFRETTRLYEQVKHLKNVIASRDICIEDLRDDLAELMDENTQILTQRGDLP